MDAFVVRFDARWIAAPHASDSVTARAIQGTSEDLTMSLRST